MSELACQCGRKVFREVTTMISTKTNLSIDSSGAVSQTTPAIPTQTKSSYVQCIYAPCSKKYILTKNPFTLVLTS